MDYKVPLKNKVLVYGLGLGPIFLLTYSCFKSGGFLNNIIGFFWVIILFFIVSHALSYKKGLYRGLRNMLLDELADLIREAEVDEG